MKLILLFWCICFSNLTFSQYSGTAEYRAIIGKDSLFQSQEILKDIYSDAMDNSSKLTFLLKFNGSESLFSLKQQIIAENIDFALSLVDFENPIYTNNFTFEKIYTSDDNEYLITDSLKTDWKLTSETKVIDNYVCYKATSEHIVANLKGTFNFPVTVWYCPALPYSFGPAGYGKLPGLIVEYQRRNFVYGLTKLTIDKDKTIALKKPSKGTKISSKEYNAKILEDYKRSREDFERSKN
ncbi:GLPGLI family protein [Flavobacterium qiangtangense]|uniref:GLPGLI family protein n=1 Tax=Flavobacterium qiangtangense TaxID=1442595 RepID=A0ABW1PTS2_9FLAO